MSQNLMAPLPPPDWEAEPPPHAARSGALAAAAAKPRNPRREKAVEVTEDLIVTMISFRDRPAGWRAGLLDSELMRKVFLAVQLVWLVR